MKTFRCAMLSLFTVLTCLCLCAARAEAPRKLTLMVYMCGSNLESGYGCASSDLQEMLEADYDRDRISVLAMTGGTKGWMLGFDPASLTIYEVGKRGIRAKWQAEACSMGVPETLTTLLNYGVENYPAEEYALILWDHGGGPIEGVCWDELFSMDNLSLSELTQALEASELPGKLSWIGFDACLMGTVEVAGALAPYASYMIASQETEPSAGWNYSFLASLEAASDGAEAGCCIIDAYFDGLKDSRDLLTLSCTDLSRVQAVENAMDDCFEQIARSMDRTTFGKLSAGRLSAGDFGSPVRAAGMEGYDLTDLGGLAAQIEDGDTLLKALSDAVVYCRSTEDGANGLSVYHPFLNKLQYTESWKSAYEKLGFCPGYSRYIRRFAELLISKDGVDWTMPPPDTAEAEAGQLLSLSLTDEQAQHFSTARLLIFSQVINDNAFSNAGLILLWSEPASLSEAGTLAANYGSDMLYLVDATGETLAGPVSYMPDEDGATFIIPALYTMYDGSDYLNVRHYLVREEESQDAFAVRTYVYDSVVEAYTNRASFDEASYDYLYVWRPIVNKPYETGLIPGFDEWETHPGASMPGFDLEGPWHGRVIQNRSPGQRLYAAFEVTDQQQNKHCTPLVELYDPAIAPVTVQPSAFSNDELRATFSMTVFSGDSQPHLELTLAAENVSGRTYKLSSSNFVINGMRETEASWFCSTMAPGTKCTTTADIKGLELYGIEAIEQISCKLIFRDPDVYSDVQEIELTLVLEDCGVVPLWGDGGDFPAEWRSEKGVSARLISIGRQEGSIMGYVLLRNDSEAALDGHQKVSLNGVIADDLFWSYLEPGMECIKSFQFNDAAALTWELNVPERPDSSWLARIDRVLERFGDGNPDELTIYLGFNDSNGTVDDRLSLPCDASVLTQSGDGAPASETQRLFSRDGVDMELDQVFLAADGLALGLVIRNTSDADRVLRFEDASLTIGDSDIGLWSMDSNRVLPARTTTVTYLALTCSGDLRAIPVSQAPALFISWMLDDGEPIPMTLRLPDTASFAEAHGMIIDGALVEE